MVKQFEDRVARLAALVEGWKRSGSVSHIERDLALDELRKLYDALLSAECGVPYRPAPLVAEPTPEPKVEVKVETTPAPEPEVVPHKADPVADFDDALDIDALLGLTDDEPEPIAEPEPVVEPTPVVVPAPEPVVEPAPAPHPGGGLFAIEDIPVRSKSSRKMINLYNSPSTSASAAQPTPAPEYVPQSEPIYQQPVAQPTVQYAPQPAVAPAPQQVVVAETAAPQRIGDVLGSGKKVVGDMQTHDNAPIAPMNKISDLRKAIGLNDKFLLLRDLFNGDVPLYERTIDTLNAFEDLDECLIYIVENFRWNPDSEGAKMLVSLIERKLS